MPPSASANDLQALEARVKALDAARETDKKVIDLGLAM